MTKRIQIRPGDDTEMPPRFPSRNQSGNSEDVYPDTSRIEAFSDGVFAVAVTLLVFNIKLPEPAVNQRLSELLLAQWPAYAGYAVSFITVGIFWANHHYMFHHIKRSDHMLEMLNVVFLMCIAFLPFPTSLVTTYVRHPSEQRTAVFVYIGTFLVSSLLFSGVWLYAAHGHRLVEENLEPRFIRKTNRKYFLGILTYAVAFAVAFWSTTLSLAIVAGVVLVFFLPTRHAPRSSSLSGS